MENNQNYEDAMLKTGLALGLFSGLGFEFADKSILPSRLKSLKPDGSTAMRDAIMLATKVMIDLGGVISQIGGRELWNFVHVVLTDGDDNASKTILDDACAVMYAIGQTLKVSTLKTYFIGVDLAPNSKAAREISALALSGGENADYFNINGVQINDIFEKIKVNVGLLQRTGMVGVASGNAAFVAYQQTVDPVIFVEKQRYVVLFTLDISGSMAGNKWTRVCESVEKFVSYLGNEDLVGAIVFNDTVKLLLDENSLRSSPVYAGYQNNGYNYPNNYNAPLLGSNNYRRNNTNNLARCVKFTIIIVVLAVMLMIFLTAAGLRI
jgi:Mg-chelatase subunit ChlD